MFVEIVIALFDRKVAESGAGDESDHTPFLYPRALCMLISFHIKFYVDIRFGFFHSPLYEFTEFG